MKALPVFEAKGYQVLPPRAAAVQGFDVAAPRACVKCSPVTKENARLARRPKVEPRFEPFRTRTSRHLEFEVAATRFIDDAHSGEVIDDGVRTATAAHKCTDAEERAVTGGVRIDLFEGRPPACRPSSARSKLTSRLM